MIVEYTPTIYNKSYKKQMYEIVKTIIFEMVIY